MEKEGDRKQNENKPTKEWSTEKMKIIATTTATATNEIILKEFPSKSKDSEKLFMCFNEILGIQSGS